MTTGYTPVRSPNRRAEFVVGQRVRYRQHALSPKLTGVKQYVPATSYLGTVVAVEWTHGGAVPVYRVTFDRSEVNHRGTWLGTLIFYAGLEPV